MPTLPNVHVQPIEDMMGNRTVSFSTAAPTVRCLIDQREPEPVTPGTEALIAA
jgi:hypothetical protein